MVVRFASECWSLVRSRCRVNMRCIWPSVSVRARCRSFALRHRETGLVLAGAQRGPGLEGPPVPMPPRLLVA
eukprot:12194498-Alexandrium_andersonii.AAC.1